MKRREFSKRLKAEIVHRAMTKDGKIACEGCGLILGAKRYEIDHVVAEALVTDKSIALTAKDGQLLGLCCHRGADGKTRQDVTRIAKAVRQSHNALGIKKRSTMPGSRDSRFKRKMDGTVVER